MLFACREGIVEIQEQGKETVYCFYPFSFEF